MCIRNLTSNKMSLLTLLFQLFSEYNTDFESTQNTKPKIGRATGLDPARPYFEDWAERYERLDKTDADFVDVIHTNAGDFWDGCLAIPWQLGHVDFYPNGGEHMAGCADWKPSESWNMFKIVKYMVNACSHKKAWEYYQESIKNYKNPNYFLAQKCSSFEEYMDSKCTNEVTLPMGETLTNQM